MTNRYRHSLLVVGAATVALALAVLLQGRGHSASARPASKGAVPQMQPVRSSHVGHEYRADYYSGKPTSPPRRRNVPRATTAEVKQGFSVLDRAQTAQERGDFDIQQFIKDRPTANIDGARALNADRTVWLIPTTDGQLCIGMKTSGPETFVNACGPATNALTTGLSMTHDGGKLALVPDAARSAQVTLKGTSSAVTRDSSRNYVWLPDGGSVTFSDASGEHTL